MDIFKDEAVDISSRLQPSVVVTVLFDEHIMVWRLKLIFGSMSLIVIKFTDVCKLDVKEMLCAKLTSVTNSCPQGDILLAIRCLLVFMGQELVPAARNEDFWLLLAGL